MTIIATIVIFCLIIFIHEFGHFLTAKLFGVTVHEFSIGMGKQLFGFTKNGTDYSVRCLPIGGYVKLEGEDSESDDVNAFSNKNVFVRFAVLFSGAFMNFLLGFILFVIIMSSASGFASNVVGEVIENSAFADAGIMSGDEIIRLEGENYSTSVNTFSDISFFNYRNGTASADVTLKRNGEVITVEDIVPLYSEEAKRHLFGFTTKVDEKNVGNILKYSFYQSGFVVKSVFFSFVDLFTGALSTSEVSGPVGIVNEIDTAAKDGILSLLSLAALLSINLGVVNLLPFPALDGGRIFFLLVELIRRKPIPPEKEGIVHAIGFVILLAFMLFITFSDVIKLFG